MEQVALLPYRRVTAIITIFSTAMKSQFTVLYDSLLLIIPKNLEPLLEEKKELIDQLLGVPKIKEAPAKNA